MTTIMLRLQALPALMVHPARWPVGTSTRLLLIFVAVGLFGYFSLTHVAPRTGDGSEYVAMFYAWRDGGRPFMTERAWESYDELYRSGAIPYLSDTEFMKGKFPTLAYGGENDFNHFWFYSLLAALPGKALLILGIQSAHWSFLTLHAAMLVGLLWLVNRLDGVRGLLALDLLIFASPGLWFIDKIHPELFVLCLTLAAVVLFTHRLYLWAFLCLAVTATQYPHFAIPALVPLAMFLRTTPHGRLTIFQAGVVFAGLGISVVHPVYYFFRYGALTPQAASGAISIAPSLDNLFVWFTDPEIGLFPNWPIGLLLLAVAVVYLWRARVAGINGGLLFFAAVYLVASLMASSIINNVNHGGTFHVARYAIWYLCLFYPITLYVLRPLWQFRWATGATVALLGILIAVNVWLRSPLNVEVYTRPTALSQWIQTNIPEWYAPHPEIFAERYSGWGQRVWTNNTRFVFSPDCRRVLVNYDLHVPVTDYSHTVCDRAVDPELFNSLVEERDDGSRGAIPGWSYVLLSEADLDAISPRIALDSKVDLTLKGNVPSRYLGPGWSVTERDGIWLWSDGEHAVVEFTLTEWGPSQSYWLALGLRPWIVAEHSAQPLTISVNGQEVYGDDLQRVMELRLPFRPYPSGRVHVELLLSGTVSPAELGIGADRRRLGVRLLSLEVASDDL